jgi:hypothetical protein
LAGIIILGPGGASMLAQYLAGQALVSLKSGRATSSQSGGGLSAACRYVLQNGPNASINARISHGGNCVTVVSYSQLRNGLARPSRWPPRH